MNFKSYSSKQTKEFGEATAKEIIRAPRLPHARVLALVGNLGAGKTTFTQGFFRGLGIKKKPASPTFVIMKRTSIRKGGFRNVFHIDAYRMKSAKELAQLGIKEIVRDPGNIVLVEWADKISRILPGRRMKIRFDYGKERDLRIIRKT